MAGRVYIGISGWRYKGWRGVFYPDGLQQRRELEFASRKFGSIEINGTHYSLQRPESFANWDAETPEGFVFAAKGSRFITHMLKLRGVEGALSNFFAQGLLRLGPKMGPILWQFPPILRFDRARFEAFFKMLPRTMKAGAKLAKKHDERLDGRDWLKVKDDVRVRHCVEIRHESFAVPEFVALLREYDIGLVAADTVEWPLLMDVTSDFVYCRLHGSEKLYVSGYGDAALDVWARRVMSWASGGDSPDGRFASESRAEKKEGRDVYVYFDNDAKVHAPFDAEKLQAKVDALMAS